MGSPEMKARKRRRLSDKKKDKKPVVMKKLVRDTKGNLHDLDSMSFRDLVVAIQETNNGSD